MKPTMKDERMRKSQKAVALAAALVLLCSAAAGETWKAAEGNIQRFETLLELLEAAGEETAGTYAQAAGDVLREIREESPDDYAVGQAVTDHWFGTVLNSGYRMYVYQGEERARELERSGLGFSGKHAFVVLGYQLENGEMTPELTGRCDSAAAAARSFPEAILVCTGGATGGNNPEGHTEAGEMKKYLSESCGIDPGRIFTDTEAMTTLENAVNAFRILRENGIGTITLVTSDYHQLWAQILFNAMAAVWETRTGYAVRIVGNYNWPARPAHMGDRGGRAGLGQLRSLLRRGVPVDP